MVFDLAPRKKPTVVETQIASAMATVDENTAATNAKLDDIVQRMGALSSWMETMSTTTTNLLKNTALLQLHAEDTASCLGLLEAAAVARSAGGSDPVTPPLVENRAFVPSKIWL